MLPSIPRRTPKSQKPPPRCAEVIDSARLTPHMQRVTLGGPELAGFRSGSDGANCKIVLPPADEPGDAFRTRLKTPSAPRTVRTFTVQHFDAATARLTIDFALHEGSAPAGDWARAARPGDLLGIMGPGARKLTRFTGGPLLSYADMTAIPAIAAILADAPETATGHAIFEVTSTADIQTLRIPKGIAQTWLIHPDPHRASEQALDLVRTLDLPPETQAAIAGEHSVVKALERELTRSARIDAAASYISPYWKIGLIEDEHQILKREAP